MAIGTWGRSRRRIITHGYMPPARRIALCGAPSGQTLDATKYVALIDCKRCRAKLAKLARGL